MSDQIELISDGDGLAVVGAKSAVERFLGERGLLALSEDLGLHKLGALAQAADSVVSGASEIAASSGRWLKLTKESAAVVKEFGLMETKTAGISHAMIGDPGSISKWLQVDTSAGALLTNPALLAGAAGVMAQLARQAEIREIKAYLAKIDEKLDDVRRSQRDAQLAKMDGVAFAIKEASKIREVTGHVSDVNWSKVQAAGSAIGETQSYALRQLRADAEKLDAAKKVGDIAKAAREVEADAAVWLTVLARCFELQESIAVIELGRVLEAAPADLDGHRAALDEAREERRSLILGQTAQLMERMVTAAGTARLNILLHIPSAKGVVDAVQSVGAAVDDFHQPLGIEPTTTDIQPVRFRDALRDWKQWKAAGKEAGPKLAIGGLVIGGVVLYVHPKTRPIAQAALGAAAKAIGK
ncbi:MAG: hypothetical protein AB7H92_18495 [Microbacteriaceae bacterium]